MLAHRRTTLVALAALTGTLGACQLVAGINGFHETDGAGGAGGSTTSSGTGGASSSSGTGGSSSSSASSSSGTTGSSSSSSGTTGSSSSGGQDGGDGGCTTGSSSDPLNCGACGHDCLGGDCTNGICQPNVIISGEPNVTGFTLAKDGSGTATGIFWVRGGTAQSNGSVMLASLSSPTLHTTVSPNECGPTSIAANATDVYWLTSASCASPPDGGANAAVVHANISGTNVAVLFPFLQGPLATIAATAKGVAWIEGGNGTVDVVPSATGKLSKYTPADGDGVVALTADQTSVYWTQVGDGVGVLAWSSMAPQPLVSGILDSLGAIAPPVGALGPYWIDPATKSIDYYDGSSQKQLNGLTGVPQGITSDGAGVYWTDRAGNVMSAVVGVGAPKILASGQVSPDLVLTDEVSVFWVSHTSSGDSITRLAK